MTPNPDNNTPRVATRDTPHQVVAALVAERQEALVSRDRFAIDRLSYLIAQLTPRQARRLAAAAQRAVIEIRLDDHIDEPDRTDPTEPDQ